MRQQRTVKVQHQINWNLLGGFVLLGFVFSTMIVSLFDLPFMAKFALVVLGMLLGAWLSFAVTSFVRKVYPD